MNRRARRGGHVTHQPLDWPIGCGAFGILTRPEGTQALVETLRFGERDTTVVRLSDGEREIIARDSGATIAVLPDDAAAAKVAMPTPRTIKVRRRGPSWGPLYESRLSGPEPNPSSS